MAARSSPGGFVVATGSFMATMTHPTGNGYCRDRILRDRFINSMLYNTTAAIHLRSLFHL